MADTLSEVKRDALLGYLSDALAKIDQFASKPFGYDNPPVGMLSSALGIPGAAKALDRLSYGEPLTTGSGWTTKLRPEALDLAGVATMVAPSAVSGLKGTARLADEMIANAAPSGSRTAQRGAIAYHGTPHRFEQFDASKIGTGEGAQAYGHGVYFAESPEIAKYYKEVLSEKMSNVGITKFNGAPQIGDPEYGDMLALDIDDAPAKTLVGKDAINYLEKYLQRFAKYDNKQAELALDWLKIAKRENWSVELPGKDTKKIEGSLYTVDIPDEMIPKMLDWDKPLSQQAPDITKLVAPVYRERLLEISGGQDVPLAVAEDMAKNLTGEKVIRLFGGGETAAKTLQQAGIPGIRYLDAGSRGTGQGTSNFVIFPKEEQRVKILKRNGESLSNPLNADPFAPTIK
jgi:hypothetical protein